MSLTRDLITGGAVGPTWLSNGRHRFETRPKDPTRARIREMPKEDMETELEFADSPRTFREWRWTYQRMLCICHSWMARPAILLMIINALLFALRGTYLYLLFLPLFCIGVIPAYGGGKFLIMLEWSTVFRLPGTVNSRQPEAYPQPPPQQPSAPTTPQGPS
jgi:hypothetical protein